MKLPTKLFLIVSLTCLLIEIPVNARSTPQLFTYNELVALAEEEPPAPALQEKLQRLLTTPFVDNSAADRGVKPVWPKSEKLGRFLRVVHWNIERGLEFDAVRSAFADPAHFATLIDAKESARGGAKRKEIMEQVALLKDADVIVLNELDWGMKRTEYRNVVIDLAAALDMNYAYGVEFVEIDPIALGTEEFGELSASDRRALAKETKVDPERYRGLHGTAILSRFRLENVHLQPFTHQPHDWFRDELKSVHPLEKGKRKAGEIVFQEKVRREVRRGGRMMLIAEIIDEQLPEGRVTIVATHLEDRAKPEGRRRQLEELLDRIKNIKGPVIVAGDMNTSTQDGTPITIKRALKNRLGSKSFWIKQGLGILTGLKLPSLLLSGLQSYRTQADPTVRSIPLFASNPEAGFFERLKDFRFADGNAFDFRGDALRSANNHGGVLANSNQRGDKGFITTYEVERTLAFVGKFKLDWIFVKPPSYANHKDEQSYRFAPHFGRTLKSLNEALQDRISDHAPIMVDLPLEEPRLARAK